MGNNMMGSRSRKAAKVMKIDGELFKFPTPAKVSDVIKDYPNHILLDSGEFLLFNLRANPLDSDHDLKPKRLYLLVELPKFPNSPLRRVQSSVSESTVVKIMTPRSVSDLSSIMTRSTVEIDQIYDGCRSSVGSSPGGGGPATRRVKMRLRKAVVDRIMAESRDEVEVVDKILKLSVEEEEREKESSAAGDGGGVAEIVVADGGSRGEGEERDAHCFKVKYSPRSSSYRHSKYKRLTS